jgi:hypothetical protein
LFGKRIGEKSFQGEKAGAQMKRKTMNQKVPNDSPSHDHDYRGDESGQEDKAPERAERDD